jgi:hypothetical protein
MRRIWLAGLAIPAAGLVMLAVLAAPTQAQAQRCENVDASTETVVSGVTVTYDSSFLCADAARQGEYAVTVAVANHAGIDEAVTVERVELSHTTPRPRGGDGPNASATAEGLPVTVAAGETARFDVRGTYELVTTDEGDKATLHLRALGVGDRSDEGFVLGVNVHLRAAGATEDGSGAGGHVEQDAQLEREAPGTPTPAGTAGPAGPAMGDRPEAEDRDDPGPPADVARFVERMRAWANCVAAEAPRQARAAGALEPDKACGAKPRAPRSE